jgi:hypothetical protein
MTLHFVERIESDIFWEGGIEKRVYEKWNYRGNSNKYQEEIWLGWLILQHSIEDIAVCQLIVK